MENNLRNNDTINLLKECDAGSKMAVSAIDEVYEKTTSPKLRELFDKSKSHHAKIGNKLHDMLLDMGFNEKDPNIMAKGMSWLKTNVMLTMKNNDQTIADLITDGCNMGIKSLYKYKNQYALADDKAIHACKELIEIEKSLRRDLRDFL